jgi:outer membrane scaffolding protein for murein synthesis (MipA/OmpV family)
MRVWRRSGNAVVAGCACLAITVAGVTLPARAQEPKWELGAGIAPIVIPDYRGSDEYRGYVLPFPFVTYRGEYVRVDREGILGRLFRTERIRLNVSANAGVPVRSSRNAARAGMPDLLPTLELGPSLELCPRIECANAKWKIRLPVRAVIATDLTQTESAGWVFNPHVTVDVPLEIRGDRWRFGAAAGVLFADERHHDYYYEVSPAFATPARPAFDAHGGYSGIRVGMALSGRHDNRWSAVFLRYDNLGGATIEDSPLVRSRHSLTAGVSVAWIFRRSATVVPEAD